MTRIEDRLREAADELRSEVADADVDVALAEVAAAPARRRLHLLGAAAAVVLAVLVGAALFAIPRGDRGLVADGPQTVDGPAIDPSAAREYVLERLRLTAHGVQISRAVDHRTLVDLLPNVEYQLADGRLVHLTDLVVLGRVIGVEPVAGFVSEDDEGLPDGAEVPFDDPDALWRTVHLTVEVEQSIGTDGVAPDVATVELPFHDLPEELPRWRSGLQSLGRAVFFLARTTSDHDLPRHRLIEVNDLLATVDDEGRLDLPVLSAARARSLLAATPTLDSLVAAGREPARRMRVGPRGEILGPAVPDGSLPSSGPDLVTPDADREIAFGRVGDVGIDDRLDPSEVDPHEGSDCGYWGPSEPSHDGDEPLGGLVNGATSSSPRVTSIMVRNPTYRTASGVGIGTTQATLQRIYGKDLVVDRADGWEQPTDGLVAYYQDVAAIRRGDHALTFYLRADVVEVVKVSSADFWGDDEGCA